MRYEVLTVVDHAFVLPTRGASVLRAMVMERLDKKVPLSTQLLIDGKPTPLMTWQAARGYANVAEEPLVQMCEALHLPELRGDVEAATVEDAAVLRLALHDNAKLTDEDLVDILSKRRVFEADSADEREGIDQQVIDDTLSPSDRKEMMEYSQKDQAASRRENQ